MTNDERRLLAHKSLAMAEERLQAITATRSEGIMSDIVEGTASIAPLPKLIRPEMWIVIRTTRKGTYQHVCFSLIEKEAVEVAACYGWGCYVIHLPAEVSEGERE